MDTLTREERMAGIQQQLPGPRLVYSRPLGVKIAPDANLIDALSGIERKDAARKRKLLAAAIALLAVGVILLGILIGAN